jgi:hypothetical protein
MKQNSFHLTQFHSLVDPCRIEALGSLNWAESWQEELKECRAQERENMNQKPSRILEPPQDAQVEYLLSKSVRFGSFSYFGKFADFAS